MIDEKRQLEELWTRFVALLPLTPDERAHLAAGLERDEVFRRRMVHDLQIHGVLRAAGELERGDEALVAQVKAALSSGRRPEVLGGSESGPNRIAAPVTPGLRTSRRGERGHPRALAARAAPAGADGSRPRRTGRVLAGAALLAAAAAGWLVLSRPAPTAPDLQDHVADRADQRGDAQPAVRPRPRPPSGFFARRSGQERAAVPAPVRARVEAVAGRTVRHGVDGEVRAAPVMELGAGDWLTMSGGTSRARLLGPGGSQMELAGDVVVGLTADEGHPQSARLFIASGRATATVPARRQGGTLVLASPHAIVLAAGKVRLQVGSKETRVEVEQGRAQVSAVGVQQGTEVEAGQLALVSADDLQVPLAEGIGRDVLLLTGPDDIKEEAPAPGGLRGSEEALMARLERLGFDVTPIDATTLVPERARAAVLLVLSSSVSTRGLPAGFADLPVPMLVLESTGFEQLGLTGKRWRRDVGSVQQATEVAIVNPSHPLAAGLSETVQVLAWPSTLRWATPPPSARVIATYPGAPERAAVFGYERGTPTASGIAPARRVALFFGNGRVIRSLTESGWRLFDAAALWATER